MKRLRRASRAQPIGFPRFVLRQPGPGVFALGLPEVGYCQRVLLPPLRFAVVAGFRVRRSQRIHIRTVFPLRQLSGLHRQLYGALVHQDVTAIAMIQAAFRIDFDGRLVIRYRQVEITLGSIRIASIIESLRDTED